MKTIAQFTAADIRYIETQFMQLDARSAERPAASYTLDDGREFYPRDYFELEVDERRFKSRLASACAMERIAPLDPEEAWTVFMDGVYGVCLKSATPENIARKNALLQRIEALTTTPNEDDNTWLAALKRAVDALDELERAFSPHYDRRRFGRPPTRDTHITAMRHKYPRIAG